MLPRKRAGEGEAVNVVSSTGISNTQEKNGSGASNDCEPTFTDLGFDNGTSRDIDGRLLMFSRLGCRASEFRLAVVFTDISLESLDSAMEFDEYCHKHQPPIAFIKTEVRGLFGSTFCDFGPALTVVDVVGEEPHTGIIACISNDNPARVACVDAEMLEFQDGDLVVFSEVRGMTELNDGKLEARDNCLDYCC